MPFELHWEPNGVVRRYFGTVTDADVMNCNQAFMDDPRFDSLHYCIVDATDVTDTQVSDSTAVWVSAAHKGASLSNPNLLLAIVTPSPICNVSSTSTPRPARAFQSTRSACLNTPKDGSPPPTCKPDLCSAEQAVFCTLEYLFAFSKVCGYTELSCGCLLTLTTAKSDSGSGTPNTAHLSHQPSTGVRFGGHT